MHQGRQAQVGCWLWTRIRCYKRKAVWNTNDWVQTCKRSCRVSRDLWSVQWSLEISGSSKIMVKCFLYPDNSKIKLRKRWIGREGGVEGNKRKEEENQLLSVCFQLLSGNVTVSTQNLYTKPQPEVCNHSSCNYDDEPICRAAIEMQCVEWICRLGFMYVTPGGKTDS